MDGRALTQRRAEGRRWTGRDAAGRRVWASWPQASWGAEGVQAPGLLRVLDRAVVLPARQASTQSTRLFCPPPK